MEDKQGNGTDAGQMQDRCRTDAGRTVGGWTERDACTLSVDVRDVQSFLQPEDHDSKLKVEGVTGTENRGDQVRRTRVFRLSL